MNFTQVIQELKSLASNDVYSKDKIELWLLKHEMVYKKLIKDLNTLNEEFPDAYIRNHSMLKNEAQFLDIYEVLLDIIDCYKNETYYKGQVEFYHQIKNDEPELRSWLWMHKFDEGKMQSKFNQLFQNNTVLTGYEFVIRYPFSLPVAIKLDESDFQHTLELISILKN